MQYRIGQLCLFFYRWSKHVYTRAPQLRVVQRNCLIVIFRSGECFSELFQCSLYTLGRYLSFRVQILKFAFHSASLPCLYFITVYIP